PARSPNPSRREARARRSSLRSQDVREHEGEERDRDDAVHREERRVETAQVAGRDQQVLVEEQPRDDEDADPVEDADVEPEARDGEEHERQQMQDAGTEERTALAEARGPGVEPLLAVDLHVEQRMEE